MRDCSAQFELFIVLLHKLQNRVGVRAQKRGEVVREIRGEGDQQKPVVRVRLLFTSRKLRHETIRDLFIA